MGDPKKQRKKYSKPSHPWQKERILEEKEMLKAYGLRRKNEIWKMNSILKNFSSQAKRLITEKTRQVELERNQLLKKLNTLGILDKNAKIADALSITLNGLMERRLQTLVYRKNLARSIKQARQFIIHKHVMIGDKTITVPSYLVSVEEESLIQFVPNSNLSDPSHPERFIEEKKSKKAEAKKPEESSKPEEKKPKQKKKPKEKKGKGVTKDKEKSKVKETDE